MGHFNPAIFDLLASRIAQAVNDAAGRLSPATVTWSAGTAKELVENRMVEGGPVDPEVGVLGFRGPGGELRAAVISFAAHPTTLGAWNRQLSADYPGVLAAAIEAKHPGAICLFFAGAVGDQAPVKRGEGFARSDAIGLPLAAVAQGLLEAPGAGVADDGRPLQWLGQELRLDPARVRLGSVTLPRWLGRALVDDDGTLTLVAIGPVLLIGAPCDLSAELGLALKARAKALGFHAMVVGFANDYIGYCLPDRFYNSRRYEARMSFNGPRTGSQLVDALTRMMDELGAR